MSINEEKIFHKKNFKKNISDYNFYFELGLKASKLLYQKSAIKYFSHSLKLNNQNPLVFINRANSYFSIKKYKKAIKDYSKAIKLDSINPVPYNNRAYGNFSLDKKNNFSFSDYMVALELDRNNPIIYKNLAMLYLGREENIKAFENFRKYYELEYLSYSDLLLDNSFPHKIYLKKRIRISYHSNKFHINNKYLYSQSNSLGLFHSDGIGLEYFLNSTFSLRSINEIKFYNYNIRNNNGVLISRNNPFITSLILSMRPFRGIYSNPFRFIRNFSILNGLGNEFSKKENLFLLRGGLEYKIALINNFDISVSYIGNRYFDKSEYLYTSTSLNLSFGYSFRTVDENKIKFDP